VIAATQAEPAAPNAVITAGQVRTATPNDPASLALAPTIVFRLLATSRAKALKLDTPELSGLFSTRDVP
jgi:hypothetical protein